jgi:putative hydrolase of the HAD superfamily
MEVGSGYRSRVTQPLLFDLDDTLIVEEAAAVAAFEATARVATGRHAVDVAKLALSARARARELWRAAPTHAYCASVAISSWEGLWCRFEGSDPGLRALRRWSATYRREAWRRGLAEQGVDDVELAEELGERFGIERRARHEVFADVEPVLAELSRSHALALVTNGASCLQREKLAASGLSGYFDIVVVSGDLGVAKPDAAVFRHALSRLPAAGGRAVMVGDNLDRDIGGAIAAGLDGVWVNRSGKAPPESRGDVVQITSLSDLGGALSRLA